MPGGCFHVNFVNMWWRSRGHRMVLSRLLRCACSSLAFLILAGSPNTRQKRSVSSAAAEHTEVPSGLCARCSTRDVCPLNSPTCSLQYLVDFCGLPS